MTTQLETLLKQRAKQALTVEIHGLKVRSADTPLPDGVICEFEGIAVPYDQPTDRVFGGSEVFVEDAIDPRSVVGLPLFRDHDSTKIVGTITEAVSLPDGLHIKAIVADTLLGQETAALLRIASLSRMSISFWPDEYDTNQDGLTTVFGATLYEISLVGIPAYPGAAVGNVRGAQLNVFTRSASAVSVEEIPAEIAPETSVETEIEQIPAENAEIEAVAAETDADSTDQTHEAANATAETSETPTEPVAPEEEAKMPESTTTETVAPVTSADVEALLESRTAAITESIKEGFRAERAAAIAAETKEPARVESLSSLLLRAYKGKDGAAKDKLNAIQKRAATDTNTVHNPAYSGGKLADVGTIYPTEVVDLVKIAADRSPLKSFFAKGTVPAEGQVATRVLLANTITSAQHVDGELVARGNIKMKNVNFDVHTVASGTTLSVEEIERATSTNIIDRSLEAMAKSLGRGDNDNIRAEYLAAFAAAPSINNIHLPANWGYEELSDAVVDAYGIFINQNCDLKGILAGVDFFKKLQRMTGADGRPAFVTYGTGTNVIGEFTPAIGKGQIFTIPVQLDYKLPAHKSAFVDTDAIRYYDDTTVSLQQNNALDLTRDIVLYKYFAVGTELPGGIAPIIEDAPVVAGSGS